MNDPARCSLKLFFILFVAFVATPASAGPLQSFRIKDWQGSAYNDGARQFERCSATKASQGISVTYSVDRQLHWSLRFSSPGWTFIAGAETNLFLKIDDLEPINGRATALEKNVIEFVSRDPIRFFADLRVAHQLHIVMGGLVFRISVDGGSEALSALTQCAVRFSHFQLSRNPKIGEASILDLNSRSKEAEDLAKLIISYSRVKNSQPQSISNSRPDSEPDSAWIIDALVTTSIKVVDTPSPLAVISNDVISVRHRSCDGGFFFIAQPETISGQSIGYLYSSCQTPDGISAAYDFVVPRPKGGHYVINESTKGSSYINVGFKLLRSYQANLRSVMFVAIQGLGKADEQKTGEQKADEQKASPAE